MAESMFFYSLVVVLTKQQVINLITDLISLVICTALLLLMYNYPVIASFYSHVIHAITLAPSLCHTAPLAPVTSRINNISKMVTLLIIIPVVFAALR